MRQLYAFLETCMMGPLSESRTLQFFIEAPVNVSEASMQEKLRELNANAAYAQGTVGKAVSVAMFEKECATNKGGHTPRAMLRREWGTVLLKKANEYESIGKDLKQQLFDGLNRPVKETEEFPESMQAHPELTGLRQACVALDFAVVEFQGANKELLFHLCTSMQFLGSLFRAAFETIVRL